MRLLAASPRRHARSRSSTSRPIAPASFLAFLPTTIPPPRPPPPSPPAETPRSLPVVHKPPHRPRKLLGVLAYHYPPRPLSPSQQIDYTRSVARNHRPPARHRLHGGHREPFVPGWENKQV